MKRQIGRMLVGLLMMGTSFSMSAAWVCSLPDAAYAARRSSFSIFIGKDRRLKIISTQFNLPPGDTYLSDGTISVTLVSPTTYKLRRVRQNDYYYLDRGFILTSLPGYLDNNNRVWIVGRDDDMLNTSSDFLQFEISDTARVYVLYDANAASLPAWLSSKFTFTGDVVNTSDPAAGTLNVYMAILVKGVIRLGGNEGTATGAQCNYVVVVRRPVNGDLGGDAATATQQMVNPRQGHRVVTLNNGRVLVVGGVDSANVPVTRSELYDSTPQTFIATGSLAQGRINPAVIKLNDGRVMAIGGEQPGVVAYDGGSRTASGIPALSSCEIFNPATQLWTAAADMGWRRRLPEAVKLADGRVFVAGGVEDTTLTPTLSTEIYDPSSNTWTAGPDMTAARWGHRLALLADGRVLIAGGFGLNGGGPDMIDWAFNTCDIFDPVANTITAAAPMAAPRGRFGFVDIGGGRFMAVAGLAYQRPAPPASVEGYITTADVEIYDAAANSWSGAAALPRGMYDFALSSPDPNRVLVFDGFDVTGTEGGEVWLYDGVLNNWTLVGNLVRSRSFPFSNGSQVVTDVGGKDYFLCGGAHYDETTLETTLLYTGERFKY